MHVVITGASVGIGEALAREFAKQGASLTLVARRKNKLEELAREIGEKKVFLYEADLSDPARATEFLEPAEKALGPVDVLINNAGMQNIEPTESASVDAGEKLLQLNVATPMRLVRAVLPGMLARKRGTIVDIASMAAITPMPGMYYYNASKGALANASEGLRGELRGTGVHVLTVYPGPVDTDMGRRGYEKYEPSLSARLSPAGTAEGLARLVVRGVAKKKARIVYPRVYAVALWFPKIARWATARFSPPIKRLS